MIPSFAWTLERGSFTTLALILCVGSFCARLGAQARGFDATNLRGPTNLAVGWLVHGGDDPAYARPDFDDSSWTPFNAQTEDLRDLFPHGRPAVVWYRLHVRVAPNETGLALLENGMYGGAFEIYLNGVKLIKAGEVAPYVRYETTGVIFTAIPDEQSTTGAVLIALRVRMNDGTWAFPRPGLQIANLTLGQQSSLREHMWYLVTGRYALVWLDSLASLCMLLGALLLYSTQRDRSEYFWLFLWMLAGIPSSTLYLTSAFHSYPVSWHILDTIGALIWPFLVARMYCAFVGHRIGWRLNLYIIFCGVVSAAANWAIYFGSISPALKGLDWIPSGVLLLIVLPVVMVRRIHTGNHAEVLLIVPLLVGGLAGFSFNACLALTSIPTIRSWAWKMTSFLVGTTAGPFLIDYGAVADFLSVLSLALIILIRSNRVSRQQALLESEMANAREIQQIILPQAVDSIPGFRIESVYEPAREVGGDFFQILPFGKDGLLLVIGDVAGKGLPAAMLVSLLAGTIRTAAEETRSPERLLSRMNKQLIGRTNGGFSSALAAYFEADGSVSIANAGHLPPYLNGDEVELPAALPLGIIEDAHYESIRICLDAADLLTFYSDGVVEAQDKHGHLLGFDRARELSLQPASTILETAKSFGQQDDITVVVIERLAKSGTSSTTRKRGAESGQTQLKEASRG